jgi:hypothetical protein
MSSTISEFVIGELFQCIFLLGFIQPTKNIYIFFIYIFTVPTNLLGTFPFFQCILMALRVLEKVQILPERLWLHFFSFFS